MIKRYNKTVCVSLVNDSLYCMVHKPLQSLSPSMTQLNPAEIWMAAKDFTEKLITCTAPEEVMDIFIEKLEEEADYNHDDAFLIAMVSMCQISALRQSIPHNRLLISQLLDYCRCHTMYKRVFELFVEKEQNLMSTNKQVDILSYALSPETNDRESHHAAMEMLANHVCSLSPEHISSILLPLNHFNLLNGHCIDDLILRLYDAYYEKTTPKAGVELTINKNIVEQGGNQVNMSNCQEADVQKAIQQIENLALYGKR